MGRWKRTLRNRRPGLEEAERLYRRLPHVKGIAVAPLNGGGRDARGLFAAIVPDAKHLTASKVASARQRIGELLDAAGARLPQALRVREFILVEPELPRADQRLLSRDDVVKRAREILERRRSAAVSPAGQDCGTAREHAARRLFARLEELAKTSGPFRPGQELETDLGIDSLAMLQLRFVLEEEFGASIPDSEFWRIRTVGDVLERVSGSTRHDDPRADISWGRIIARAPREFRGRSFDPERKLFHRILFRAMKGISWLIVKLAFRVEIENPEKLPRGGPAVIAPNHIGYLDPLFMYASFPARLVEQTHFIAFAEILSKPHLAWLARFSRLILTGDAETTVDSLRRARQAFASGQAVCIFPEGSRSPTGEVVTPRPGAGLLSVEAQAPILPVFIEGGEKVTSPRFPGLHFPKVRLVLGDLIRPPRAGAAGSRDYQAVVERWREAILRLQETARRERRGKS
jgi:acyl carrier protein